MSRPNVCRCGRRLRAGKQRRTRQCAACRAADAPIRERWNQRARKRARPRPRGVALRRT